MHQNKFFIMGAGVHPKASEGTYLKGYAAPKTRKLISLFSGAMGLDLGLEAAGFDLAGCLEFNHVLPCTSWRGPHPVTRGSGYSPGSAALRASSSRYRSHSSAGENHQNLLFSFSSAR